MKITTDFTGFRFSRPTMKEKAVVVKVEITDGGLNAGPLNAELDAGWYWFTSQTSTPGSILVILRDEPLVVPP